MNNTNHTKKLDNPDGFGRFSERGFCGNVYSNFFEAICAATQNSYFYVNILQFGIVTLMYVNIGKGRYWKILFYAALGGCVGALIENLTTAYLCVESRRKTPYFKVYPFLIEEVCWIVEEFSVPFLNLTKMKAFSKGKLTKFGNYAIYALFVLFVIFRFCIGYTRMKTGLLSPEAANGFHSLAFGVMAVADIICTFGILYYVRKHNQQENINTSNINHYIKRSSYIILICVDIVSIMLSLFNFLIHDSRVSEKLLTPFHCVKCSFTLILACDALLFKYSVNTSSIHESSGNYRFGDSYNYTSSFKSYNNKSRIEINNKSQNNPLSSITPYNYPSLDYGKSDSSVYQTKSIVKNYTNIKPSNASTAYDSTDNDKNNFAPSQQFGFLYPKDY